MEAGSIRQRSKSACFPGSVSVAEEFRAFGFSVRRAVPGIVGLIARVPKLSGSSTAVRPAASLAIARTLLSGQRTRGSFGSPEASLSGLNPERGDDDRSFLSCLALSH